jgi:hypothetical protein
MANKFSTGLAIGINGNKGLKELMSDFIIHYYGGTPATTTQALRDAGYSDADAVVTSNPLATFTKGGATLTGTASTRQEAQVVVTAGSTNDTAIFTFSTPSKTLTYTQTAADTTADLLVTSIVAALNADTTINKVVEAIAVVGAAVTESIVLLRAIYPGEPFVVVVTQTGTLSVTTTDVTANVRINSLHFDAPDAYGDIWNEAAYTWLATGLIADTATWFRVVKPDDDGTLSHTAPRIQGGISTAGAEINLQPSTAIVVDQPLSITSYKVNVKKSVA